MKDFACWDLAHLRETLSIDADHMSSAVFMAVHTLMPLQSQQVRGGKTAGEVDFHTTGDLDELQVLRDVLDPGRDFVLMPVLGDVGSGKSHLIRWLSEHIPQRENRRVIRVARTANVRRVLLDMLEGIEGEPFGTFRRDIERAAGQLPRAAAREKLLNDISLYAGVNSPEPLASEDTREKIAAKQVQVLLHEPRIRARLLAEGGVVDRVAQDTLRSEDSTPGAEAKIEFDLEDLALDLDLAERELSELGVDQQNALRIVAPPPVRLALVSVLNQALKPAARHLLNFRDSSHVAELFNAVRIEFGRSGIELVLLIEDLVKMSTIADPLLDLAMQRPRPDAEAPLCPIRTVFACTPGRFHLYIETLRSRVEPYLVWTQSPVQNDEAYLQRLSGRYLNATRVGPKALADWYASGGGKDTAPPNACRSCRQQETCHEAFGVDAASGFGFYPFTARALGSIGRQVMGAAGFNPRNLIKSGIDPMLRRATEELEDSRFPSGDLLRAFGIQGMSPAQKQALRNAAGDETAGRLDALVSIWGAGDSQAVPAAVADVFGLSLSALARVSTPPSRPGPATDGVATREVKPTASEQEWPPPQGSPLGRVLNELRGWQAGDGRLSQGSVRHLRELVHEQVASRMPWSTELIAASLSARDGSEAILPGKAIYFRGQSAGSSSSDIEVVIPIEDNEDERLRSAAVLEYLLRYKHCGDWGFADGSLAYAQVRVMVDHWVEHAIAMVRARFGPLAEGGDPLLHVVWLLWVANLLAGRALASGAGDARRIDHVLSQPPDEPVASLTKHRGNAWRQALERFAGREGDWSTWRKLRDVLLDHIGARKGRRGRPISIDAARVASLLSRIAGGDGFQRPEQRLPARGGLRAAAEILDSVQGALGNAVTEESDRLQRCHRQAVQYFGEVPDFDEVQRNAASAVAAVEAAAASRTTAELHSVVKDLSETTDLASTWASLGRLSVTETVAMRLAVLAGIKGETTGRLERLTGFFVTELSAAEEAMRRQVDQLRSDSSIPAAEVEVRTAVEGLLKALRTVDRKERT